MKIKQEDPTPQPIRPPYSPPPPVGALLSVVFTDTQTDTNTNKYPLGRGGSYFEAEGSKGREEFLIDFTDEPLAQKKSPLSPEGLRAGGEGNVPRERTAGIAGKDNAASGHSIGQSLKLMQLEKDFKSFSDDQGTHYTKIRKNAGLIMRPEIENPMILNLNQEMDHYKMMENYEMMEKTFSEELDKKWKAVNASNRDREELDLLKRFLVSNKFSNARGSLSEEFRRYRDEDIETIYKIVDTLELLLEGFIEEETKQYFDKKNAPPKSEALSRLKAFFLPLLVGLFNLMPLKKRAERSLQTILRGTKKKPSILAQLQMVIPKLLGLEKSSYSLKFFVVCHDSFFKKLLSYIGLLPKEGSIAIRLTRDSKIEDRDVHFLSKLSNFLKFIDLKANGLIKNDSLKGEYEKNKYYRIVQSADFSIFFNEEGALAVQKFKNGQPTHLEISQEIPELEELSRMLSNYARNQIPPKDLPYYQETVEKMLQASLLYFMSPNVDARLQYHVLFGTPKYKVEYGAFFSTSQANAHPLHKLIQVDRKVRDVVVTIEKELSASHAQLSGEKQMLKVSQLFSGVNSPKSVFSEFRPFQEGQEGPFGFMDPLVQLAGGDGDVNLSFQDFLEAKWAADRLSTKGVGGDVSEA